MEVAVVTERDTEVGDRVMTRLGDAFRLARAILLDDGEAEDAVQEACFTAWRKRRTLRDPDSFGPWFDRILVNQCRDQLRRRSRRVRIAAGPVDILSTADPSTSHDEADDVDADLDRALAALDVDHRIVVVMRYWQDRTVDDIAARVGIPSGTVKSRLHHALRSLRASLEADHGRS